MLNPYEREFTEDELRGVDESFHAALSLGDERSMQECLEKHPVLLGYLVHYGGYLAPQFRLADSFVTDFVAIGTMLGANIQRATVIFVEIERSSGKLFNKSGDPSAMLTHALRQVQDWKNWVCGNRLFLATRLSKSVQFPVDMEDLGRELASHPIHEMLRRGFADRYLVIAGRRETLTEEGRERLWRMNEDLQGITIVTYDHVLDEFRNVFKRRTTV